MNNVPPPVDGISDGIDELIEEHLARLTEKVNERSSIPEIADEVSSLNDLLISYRLRDELLEQLLDRSTAESRRQQILATLPG